MVRNLPSETKTFFIYRLSSWHSSHNHHVSMSEMLSSGVAGRALFRLVTYSSQKFPGGLSRVGVLLDDHSVVDVQSCLPDGANRVRDMQSLIEAGADLLSEVKRVTKIPPAHAITSANEVTLSAPLPRPKRNVFCLGKNYSEHVSEMKVAFVHSALPAGQELPEFPIFFTKAPECVIAPLDYIEGHEKISSQLDYEAEMVVVIGKGGRDITAEKAMEHVFGYSIANDVSSRDLQKKHMQWFKGKSLDRSCPMGPCIVPADELDASDLTIKLWLNGELKQNSRTSKMIFQIPAIIENLSAGFTLIPGDVILTGTPDGVGIAQKPPRTLLPGDKVRIEIEHIGVLENDVK